MEPEEEEEEEEEKGDKWRRRHGKGKEEKQESREKIRGGKEELNGNEPADPERNPRIETCDGGNEKVILWMFPCASSHFSPFQSSCHSV